MCAKIAQNEDNKKMNANSFLFLLLSAVYLHYKKSFITKKQIEIIYLLEDEVTYGVVQNENHCLCARFYNDTTNT